MSKSETDKALQEIVDYVKDNELRCIMVLSHDSKFAIAKERGLIHRDRADMRWFKKITTGRVCIVGSGTWNEVRELPERVWVLLSNRRKLDGVYITDSLSHGITYSRLIADSKSMNKTVVIAGGAHVYNSAVDKDLPEAIIATVWDADLGGDLHVNDYTEDGRYRLYNSTPLDVVGDVPATVKLFIREK